MWAKRSRRRTQFPDVYKRHLEDVPLPVSVNEATTLARLYGGEENAAYVNGVLGAIQRELEGSR